MCSGDIYYTRQRNYTGVTSQVTVTSTKLGLINGRISGIKSEQFRFYLRIDYFQKKSGWTPSENVKLPKSSKNLYFSIKGHDVCPLVPPISHDGDRTDFCYQSMITAREQLRRRESNFLGGHLWRRAALLAGENVLEIHQTASSCKLTWVLGLPQTRPFVVDNYL